MSMRPGLRSGRDGPGGRAARPARAHVGAPHRLAQQTHELEIQRRHQQINARTDSHAPQLANTAVSRNTGPEPRAPCPVFSGKTYDIQLATPPVKPVRL